jgi:hypothetical protein
VLSECSTALRTENSPVGLLQHRWGAPACLLTPPEAWSSHQSRHPQAAAAVGEATRAAVGWLPMGRCPSPTWQDPPRGHAFHRAENRHRRNSLEAGSTLQLSGRPSQTHIMPLLEFQPKEVTPKIQITFSARTKGPRTQCLWAQAWLWLNRAHAQLLLLTHCANLISGSCWFKGEKEQPDLKHLAISRCKYSHYGQFQITNLRSLTELERWASSRAPLAVSTHRRLPTQVGCWPSTWQAEVTNGLWFDETLPLKVALTFRVSIEALDPFEIASCSQKRLCGGRGVRSVSLLSSTSQNCP